MLTVVSMYLFDLGYENEKIQGSNTNTKISINQYVRDIYTLNQLLKKAKLVSIEPLKTWNDVTNLEFIIYLVIFEFHFYLSWKMGVVLISLE